MGLRIRKRIRIMSGVYVNLGKNGASLSLGGKGATVNIGKRGTTTTLGIPGTGISYTTRSVPPKAASATRAAVEIPPRDSNSSQRNLHILAAIIIGGIIGGIIWGGIGVLPCMIVCGGAMLWAGSGSIR